MAIHAPQRPCRVRGIVETEVARDLTIDHQPGRANAALRAALARGVEWGVLSTMPIGKIKRRAEDENAIVRYLLEDEEARLRAALATRDEPGGLRASQPISGAISAGTRSGRPTEPTPTI